MTAVAEMFGGIWRMICIGWGQEGVNPYQKDSVGKLVKSDVSTEIDEGEGVSESIDAMCGISKLDRKAQAGLIRRDVEKALSKECYALIELRYTAPVCYNTESRKLKALNIVVGQVAQIKDYPVGYIHLVCAIWAGERVTGSNLIVFTSSKKCPGGSSSTEARWRKDLLDYLDLTLFDAVDIARRRL